MPSGCKIEKLVVALDHLGAGAGIEIPSSPWDRVRKTAAKERNSSEPPPNPAKTSLPQKRAKISKISLR
jgi:hypothetical protein